MPLIPGWAEIDSFRQPLTEGERTIIRRYEALAAQLDRSGEALEVYVQPYLENLRPDLIVSRPGQSALVFEVKDWAATSGFGRRKHVPGEQTHNYRNALLNLGLSNVESKLQLPAAEHKSVVSACESSIQTAVYMHGLTEEQASARLGRRYEPDFVLGADSKTLPLPRRSGGVTDSVWGAFWEGVQMWLRPPFHRKEQGQPVRFTATQRRYVGLRDPGDHPWRRVRGPAGAGKSLILAHKAAQYASLNARVLVVYFNTTLGTYLRDLVARMPFDFQWENITIAHFHDWLKSVRLSLDEPAPLNVDGEDYLDETYPKAVDELIRTHNLSPEYHYDAVLIDEGQDFLHPWVSALARAVSPDGELLVVADQRQNVYKRDLGWGEPQFDGFVGQPGFRGRWGTLETTVRLSPRLSRVLSRFSERFQQSESFVTDPLRAQQKLNLGTPFLRWENVPTQRLFSRLADVIREVTSSSDGHPSDLAVVMQTNDDAFEAVRVLQRQGLNPLHVYNDNGRRVPGKLFQFRRGDGRVKVITGHSFKGFEVYGVIVCAKQRWSKEAQADWLYTAMRGGMESVWVINADQRFTASAEIFAESSS